MAYRLHLDGLSYREIAETMRKAVASGQVCGFSARYSHGNAYDDVQVCARRIQEAFVAEVEPRRQKMRDRLERLFAQAWRQSRGNPDRQGIVTMAEEDRIGWSGEARSALDQLAKLDGLYAPTKVAPTNPAGDKPFDVSEAIDPTAVGLRAANFFADLFAKLGPDVLGGEPAPPAPSSDAPAAPPEPQGEGGPA